MTTSTTVQATNPATLLSGSTAADTRIDTATAIWVSIALVAGLLYVCGYRYMRTAHRIAESERQAADLIRRANDSTIRAGLVARG
jgi:hypothetical protein